MTRRRLVAVFKGVYGITVAAVLAWALWQAWHNPAVWKPLASRPGPAVFVACWAAMAGLLGLAWSRLLESYLGLCLSAREWLPVQGAAWAGRYLPGKLGLLAGKLSLLARKDLSLRGLTFSVLFEQVAFVVTGLAVALLATLPLQHFGIDLPELPLGQGGQQLLRIVAAGLICASLFPALHIVASRMAVTRRPAFSDVLVILALYLSAHVLAGLGLEFVLLDVLPHSGPTLLYVISLLAAANVAGIVAFFAPAGLGVREAVLVAGLAPYLSPGDALAIAAILRVLTLLADLLFVSLTGGVALLARHRRVGC